MFGFTPRYVLATRPKHPLGTKKDWDLAENALENALKKKNIEFQIDKEAGAFYGPKIEIHMEDAQKRDWQLGTAQLDLVMLPKQFNLSYIDESGTKKMPWVIHRAIFGSFERFIGILLEHFNGALPFWLAPVQTAILPVSEKHKEYAEKILAELIKKEIRAELHAADDTLGKRIRGAELQKIPFLLVVGEKEMTAQTVAVRERKIGDRGTMNLESFINLVVTSQ
jgi:threonyl-tRNA synthetase